MSWLAIALWGGAVGLDATSFPQVMISRPLVAAAITGLIAGRPLEGAAIGVLLEIFALVILPIGAAKYPEAGTGSVAAAAAYLGAAGAGPEPHLIVMATAFGLVWERVTGASANAVRRLNERLVAAADGRATTNGRRLERLHLTAVAADYVRGALTVTLGAALGLLLLRSLGPLWAPGPGAALGVLTVAGAAMIGATLPLFGGWSERRIAFGLGLLCGFALLLLR